MPVVLMAGAPSIPSLSSLVSSIDSRLLRKVTYLLNELGLDYETKYVNSKEQEHKSPEYLKLNPNGRMPTLVDHKNNDYTIWCVPSIILGAGDIR